MLRNAVGGGGVRFPGKKRYVISVTRGWVGVKFPGKKHYVTLEWPQTNEINNLGVEQYITSDQWM